MGTTPVFDPKADHATVYGSGAPEDGTPVRYCQNGHYFAADHKYVKSDPNAIKAPPPKAAVSAAQVQTLPAVDPSEVEELLKDDRAAALLALPADTIGNLVKISNGPVVAGEGSHRSMVAFLLKHTAPSTVREL